MKSKIFFWSFFLVFSFCSSQQVNYEQQRERLVKRHIEAQGITDKNTLKAINKVERHKMVPKEMQRYAYEDTPLPIGNDQTISQPFIVAFMTQAIAPKAGMKVLEIGTGSGYQAAVLAEIVDEVYTIETVEPLAKRARKTLTNLGYRNIYYRIGDGYHGWEEHAPFDAIIVTAAPEEVPPRLVEQLKTGGKMVIPVGPLANQHLQLIEKNKDGSITTQDLLPVRFVPFTRRE